MLCLDASAPTGGNCGENSSHEPEAAGIIHTKVSGELAHAYSLGLDIRSDVVVGTMYALAVQVWSMIDEYTSPSQDEGRR